jgi:hypothetical protein
MKKSVFSEVVEWTNHLREKVIEKVIEGKNIVLVGLPNSGKTVFFITMINQLQRRLSSKECKYSIISNSRSGSNLGDRFFKTIRKGAWPDKTETGADDKAIFSYRIILEDNMVMTQLRDIDYLDYPGEAYQIAFGDHTKLSDPNNNIKETYGDDADKIKSHINDAYGVFVIIDSEKLFEEDNELFNDIVWGLSDKLSKSKVKKVALVFTKTDMCPSKEKEDLIQILNDQNPDTLNQLQRIDFESFMVSAVEAEVNLDGILVPIKDYSPEKHSKGVLEPIKWMLNLKEL